ncbi:hypothetical protein [Brevibacterium aurantiacum]|uniref:Uncharacterized protein n=1 Tax=Brevibacterium aurantiacum TaxID=273384 RepID=A0A2A3Z0B6_BREAU|nr:hypothetical protein [Brevibacterium aurantiacum]PCC45502.1 hypothetical protein CIK64_15300 [Brevibacterium aurantiacum]
MMKDRRDTVKTLAKLDDEKATLQAKISKIEKQESDAYELALASGWSQSELKKMGFTRKTGPRRAKKTKDDSTTITPNNGQEASAQTTPQRE